MKSKTRLISITTLVLLFAASSAFAATETYKIDPVHSTIGFKVRHLVANVTGRFADVTGTIHIDPEHPENSSVEATIQAKSIDTANEKRDGHLKSADFFDVEKFSTMTFKSKKVKQLDKETADVTADVTGDLTIHGVTKEVTLHVQFLGKGKGMDGTPQTGWEATTKINRKEFGLVWSKMIEGTSVVGDDVNISLQIESDLVK